MAAATEHLTRSTPSGRLGTGPRRPLSAGERVAAVVAHHLTVYRRTWKGSIIGRFLSPLFFLLAMGLGLGSLVDGSAGGVGGQPYLQYVVPGIVAVQAMWLSFSESTYAVFGYLRWNQMYAGMLATPLRVTEVLGGHLAVVGLHLLVATAIFIGVAALFGAFTSGWVLMAVPVGLVTGSPIDGIFRAAIPMAMYRAFPTPARLRTFVSDQLTTLDEDWMHFLGDAVRNVRMDSACDTAVFAATTARRTSISSSGSRTRSAARIGVRPCMASQCSTDSCESCSRNSATSKPMPPAPTTATVSPTGAPSPTTCW